MFSKLKYGLYHTGRKIQDIIVPDLRNSQHDYFEILEQEIPLNARWLDIGCSEVLYYKWVNDIDIIKNKIQSKTNYVVGIDASDQNIKKNNSVNFKLVADINNLPFKDNSFDYISANMVIEHIKKPEIAINEIYRILAPESKYIFHTPNKLNYAPVISYLFTDKIKKKLIKLLEGRDQEDVFPTYYRMNSIKKIQSVVKGTKFKIAILLEIQSSPITTALGPFVIFELLFIKLLNIKIFKKYRSNFIIVLEK